MHWWWNHKKIEWTEEADQAFAHLKKVLSTLPVPVAPNEKEPWYEDG
jgi:hypothetical protein